MMGTSQQIEKGDVLAHRAGAHGNPVGLTQEAQSLETPQDKKKERRLTMKIDLAIIPMVSLLYLFCFIDRANIGESSLQHLSG